MSRKSVVVTGAGGFIGRNLCLRLAERGEYDVWPIGASASPEERNRAVSNADVIVHLAGVNRPENPTDFMTGNHGSIADVVSSVQAAGKRIPIILTSSIQAENDNLYGVSKKAAEDELLMFAERTGNPVWILRLPNVFGKWARPNYNSAVATFCYNVSRGMDINIHDPSAPLNLIYIDDVVDRIIGLIDEGEYRNGLVEVGQVYRTTVGDVADTIRNFPKTRDSLVTPRVGGGLTRALYSTYLSYLEPSSFAYNVPIHADSRGVFVEMLKTPDCGQFSYFTAGPGITRGEHYHHTKTEKFLVLTGVACFAFRHMLTDEFCEVVVAGGEGRIVETIPGWTHNVTNVGTGEMVVMLWANEIFDRSRPDTIFEQVRP